MHYTDPNVYKFISKQTNDPIAERKVCRASWQSFAIFQSDVDFYNKISPVFDGKKYQIPTPSLCPEERQRRRLAFRNERKLYKRQCDATSRTIISNYKPSGDYIVYSVDQYFGDGWESKDAWIDIDFSKSVNWHLDTVLHRVPHIALMMKMNENCEYVNGCGNSKNCYLVFDSDFCEECYYSSVIKQSTYVVDSNHVYFSEIAYNCINCTESYHLLSCYECDTSRYLLNCTRCSNCTYCINCSNLVGQSYCINNQQVSKEAYEKAMKEYVFSYSYPSALQRATYKVRDEGGIGNNLYECKDCTFSYNIGFSEGLKYCDLVTDAKNCYDISSFGGNTEWCLDCGSIGTNVSKTYFSYVVTAGCSDIFYSYGIFNCHHMFWCAYMKNASYCIFNKQYTKEEYETIVPTLIEHMQQKGEWGEFREPRSSPFGYDETVAMDYYPLTQEEALAKGFNRSGYVHNINIPDNVPTIRGSELPVTIQAVDDSILNKIILCETTGRPFRIVKSELEFYRTYDIPLPKDHPDTRYDERIAQIPWKVLFMRTCDKCAKEIVSVYKDEQWAVSNGKYEKVCCEECYQKEVFG